MIVHNLALQNTILNNYIAEMRDITVQKDRMRFRRNLVRAGEIFAYEISKQLDYHTVDVVSPLGISSIQNLKEYPVLATILRAGLPLHEGLLSYFDKSDNCFISAYRKHKNAEDFDIEIEYLSSPSLEGKTVILTDTMLATGSSMVLGYKALLQRGRPSKIHVVSVIASTAGVEFVKKHFPPNTELWIAALDDELTAQSYIVPGLGDAGDLAYGEKD
jgi:uracil phosphoribosyltransferase